VRFDRGKIAVEDARDGNPELRVSGPDAKWNLLLASVPPPHHQDVLMASNFGPEVTFEGDRTSRLFPFYPTLQRFFEIMREVRHGEAPDVQTVMSDVPRDADDIVGRYLYLTIDEVQYRVFYEEAGEGIPILCHHTGGADSRQYRHFLQDADFRRRFRMIAFDLPYHGRSLPPVGKAWWAEEYRLTLDFLRKFVVGFSRALSLDRPVFLGCSLGGYLAADLAYYDPQEFRAVIAMNTGVYAGRETVDEESLESWRHPRIYSDWKGAAMRGVMSPSSPEALRREIAWIYAQGAPPVFPGDINYAQVEHDLRGKLGEIDTARCAVYVLAGEYDPSTLSPKGSKGVADGIAGATYTVVPGVGHFIMSENPERFKEYITPVLDDIAAKGPAPECRSASKA
jgi:pimeloyl-ACP methyl ester carboxylesterase